MRFCIATSQSSSRSTRKGDVYALKDDRRMNLEFYKNNIVHLFIQRLSGRRLFTGAGKQRRRRR